MKIQQVQPDINFRERYLPQNLSKNIQSLKQKMKAETVIIKSNEIRKVINVRGLNINNGEALFKDGRFLAKRNKNNEIVPYGSDTAMIEFGKVRLISNGNGEIIEHKKPFYITWSSIIKKADNYIKFALDNYNNNAAVIKLCNKKENLTKAGLDKAKKLIEIFDSINPFA